MRVADLQTTRLLVPGGSKGRGKSRKARTIRITAAVRARLEPCVAGRGPNEPLLMRWHHTRRGQNGHNEVAGSVATGWRGKTRGKQRRSGPKWSPLSGCRKGPCRTACAIPASCAACRRACPRRGAKLHDTSVMMLERTYGATSSTPRRSWRNWGCWIWPPKLETAL